MKLSFTITARDPSGKEIVRTVSYKSFPSLDKAVDGALEFLAFYRGMPSPDAGAYNTVVIGVYSAGFRVIVTAEEEAGEGVAQVIQWGDRVRDGITPRP